MDRPVPRRVPAPGPDSRRGVRWIDRWMSTVADLAALKDTHPMLDAVIDEVDGRMIRIGDHWLADFASCNYLGFDLDREIIESVPEYLDRWGTHPSWSRLLGSPVLYEQIEERLCELLGAEDTLVLPTITLIHMSVIPVLAGGGTIFLERRAPKTILHRRPPPAARGAAPKEFALQDVGELQRVLEQKNPPSRPLSRDRANNI